MERPDIHYQPSPLVVLSTAGWRPEYVLLNIRHTQVYIPNTLHFTHNFSTISILSALRICEEDAHKVFLKQKSRKAAEHGISFTCLRTQADQTSVTGQITGARWRHHRVNDYRPVCCQVKDTDTHDGHHCPPARPLFSLQHFISRSSGWCNPDGTGLYPPGLQPYREHQYIVYDKIVPDLIGTKQLQVSVPTITCLWITSFLTDRQTDNQQQVQVHIHIQHLNFP